MSSVKVDTILDSENKTDEPNYAHIVDRGNDERDIQAIILEARIYGLVLTAICGHRWIPSRDPQKCDMCPKCEELIPVMQSLYGV